MEYIKKILSKPTDWLLLGVVICLTVLVFYNRTVEHMEDDEPTTSDNTLPVLPVSPTISVNELPVSPEALRKAIGEVYRADISAIKNLSDIAKALQEGRGIRIPGKLVVNGETDLVGSVYKLKVAGETNLVGNVTANGKLTVDGETSLKNKLIVSEDTSLNSKLNVAGETTLGNLTGSTNVVQYVATDANKNLVSSPNAASLISYAMVTGSNITTFSGIQYDHTNKRYSVQIDLSKKNESGVGITNSSNKLTNTSGKKVTCMVTCSGTCDIDRWAGAQIRIRKEDNNKNMQDTNMNGYVHNPHNNIDDWGLRHTINTHAIITLEPNQSIDFMWDWYVNDGINGGVMQNFIASIIGLY
jgi:hypothetical protein